MRRLAPLLLGLLCSCVGWTAPPLVQPVQPWTPTPIVDPVPAPPPAPVRPGALTFEQARTVQVGEARDVVLERLGKPLQREPLMTGEEDVAWHATSETGGAALLIVRFGADGLVTSVVLW